MFLLLFNQLKISHFCHIFVSVSEKIDAVWQSTFIYSCSRFIFYLVISLKVYFHSALFNLVYLFLFSFCQMFLNDIINKKKLIASDKTKNYSF